MAAKKNAKREKNDTEVLKDLLIVQLGVAGVPQTKVREIVGCDMNRVNRILKYVKPKKEEGKKKTKKRG